MKDSPSATEYKDASSATTGQSVTTPAASRSMVQLRGKSMAEQEAALRPDTLEQDGNAVQRKGGNDSADVHSAAERGTAGSGGTLPHLDKIQGAFGRHDVSDVQTYTGGAAKDAAAGMGAEA